MRSTIVDGNAALPSIHRASEGSCAVANACTMPCSTLPLCGRLSQQTIVSGPAPLRAPQRERARQQSDDADRGLRRCQIAHDVRMLEVQRAARGIVAVAFLGDGQRDDLRRGIGEPRVDTCALVAEEQNLAHAADDAPPHAGAALLDGRVQPVLRRHPVAHVRAAQAHAADAPRAAGRGDRVVGVDRLMGAMKRADAEVDDAHRQTRRVVRRSRDRRRQRGRVWDAPGGA